MFLNETKYNNTHRERFDIKHYHNKTFSSVVILQFFDGPPPHHRQSSSTEARTSFDTMPHLSHRASVGNHVKDSLSSQTT